MLERTLAFFVLSFVWLVPAASAQSPGGGGGFHHGTLTPGAGPPPSPYADAVFGDMVVGEFTGDLGLDAVVMDDGQPALLMSPEVFITNIPGPAGNDIAKYRYIGQQRDVLLVVNSTGLQKLEYAGPTGDPWTTTTLQGTTWVGARAVRSGSFGWTSAPDIVGLASSANPAQVLVQIATPAGAFIAGTGIMAGGPAYGLEVIDWNGTGFDEIAVLTSLGIEIWGTTAGSFQTGYSWTSSPIVVAVLHDDIPAGEGGGDRLAFVLTDANEEQYLGIFSRNGVEDPDLLFLGEAGIVGATAADTDGDGDEDLFLTSTEQASFLVLTNLSPATPSPSTPTFDYDAGDPESDEDEAQWVPFGDQERDPTGNAAGLAIGDFDGDTDLDVLAPAQGDGTVDGRVHFVRNELVDHRAWLPTVTSSLYTLDQTLPEINGVLDIFLAPPAQLLTESGGSTRWLKVTVWRAPDHELFTEHDVFVPVEYINFTPPVEFPASFDFQTGETTAYTYSAIHTVVMRQVLRDAGGNVVEQKPALILINASEENYAEITGQEGVEFQQLRGNYLIMQFGEPDSRTGGGGVIGPPPPGVEDEDPPPPRPDPAP